MASLKAKTHATIRQECDVSPENYGSPRLESGARLGAQLRRRGSTKRSRFSWEQIAYVLRQVEAGTRVADACRQMGVSDATFNVWKKKYAGPGVGELRRLRQIEDENTRLKQVVADPTLDKHMLSEALRSNV